MSDITLNSGIADGSSIEPASRPNLDKGFNPLTMILFFGILAAGLLFVAYSIYVDIEATGAKVTTFLPYILLFVALLIALGFEFVNGFHDTANAVATVIYLRWRRSASGAGRSADQEPQRFAVSRQRSAVDDRAAQIWISAR